MKPPWSSIAAATLLGLLTLTVFGTLRDFGPESVVRRFHQAAVQRDVTEIREISTSQPGSQSAETLAARVEFLMRTANRVELRRVERKGDLVVAEFVYFLPRQAAVILWVCRRTQTGWKVSTDETLRLRV